MSEKEKPYHTGIPVLSEKEILSSTGYDYMDIDCCCQRVKPLRYGVSLYRLDKSAVDGDYGDYFPVNVFWRSFNDADMAVNRIRDALTAKGNYLICPDGRGWGGRKLSPRVGDIADTSNAWFSVYLAEKTWGFIGSRIAHLPIPNHPYYTTENGIIHKKHLGFD